MEQKILIELRDGADILFKVLTQYRPLLSKFENDRAVIYGQLNNEANRTFLLLRKIIKACEVRLDEMTSGLSKPDTFELVELQNRARTALVLPTDRVNSLLSEKVEAPIPLNELGEKLAALFRKLDIEAAQTKKTVVPSW